MSCLRSSFENGTILNGRYRTEQPLNHGSFGMVFMATDLETKNMVAIKCMTKQSAAAAQDIDCQQTFLVDDRSEELEIHERLGNHSGIVSLLDSFETSSHLYLVLEFCERGDLYEAIRSDCGPGETEHVRKFMLQVVDAVEYMHSRGVYHRDIKPENIFISKSGDMKLGDFGLATTEEWCEEHAVGSDRYMAPEQYDHAGNGYSPAQSDIWSIGVCLLNILFSRNPFTRPTMDDPLFRDFAADKQSLFDVFPDMSQDTFEVISQCMSIDPSKRSLSGLRKALLRVDSFTNFDEVLDEFMLAERPAVPDANRVPLRTPSIQSPILNDSENPFFLGVSITESYHRRHLSVILDEDVDEPLFDDAELKTPNWCDATPGSSVMASSMGSSVQNMSIPRQIPTSAPRSTLQVGSMPILKAKPQTVPSLAFSFGGGKGASGISWSDLVDDDEDEFDMITPEAPHFDEDHERVYSHDSIKSLGEDVEHETMFDMEMPAESMTPTVVAGNDDSFLQTANALMQEDAKKEYEVPLYMAAQPIPITSRKPLQLLSTNVSTPRSVSGGIKQGLAKWEALGQRRRGLLSKSATPPSQVYDFGNRNFGSGSCGVYDAVNSRYNSRNGRDRGRDRCHNGISWAHSKNWREHRPQLNTWVGLDY